MCPCALVIKHYAMRLGGPQSRSGRSQEEKILYRTGNRTATPVAIPTTLSQLLSESTASQKFMQVRKVIE
jgi:hypothetical protein